MKTALITGVSGQDGAYLSKLLLEKGYRVIGSVRNESDSRLPRLVELGISKHVELATCTLEETASVTSMLVRYQPDEIYNLAAQSFIGVAWEQPLYTVDVGGVGAMRLLEGVRMHCAHARYYQASTSEMFGKTHTTPQDECTPFYPRNPYGIAKLLAHSATASYRETLGLHASSGILFNHESPLRGMRFATRKITLALARIVAGKQDAVELGNLNATRDWGYAGDYVDGMWRMLQQPVPGDYVLATGEAHTVREFLGYAGEAAGMAFDWQGDGVNETGIDSRSGKVLVRVNEAFFRPSDTDMLVGNSTRAREKLGWSPKVGLRELAHIMFEADARRVRDGLVAF